MQLDEIPLYANETEKRQHNSAIALLCEEMAKPDELIRPIYEDILMEMKKEAKIKDYLALLVCRTIRDLAHGEEESSFLRLDEYHVKLFHKNISTAGVGCA